MSFWTCGVCVASFSRMGDGRSFQFWSGVCGAVDGGTFLDGVNGAVDGGSFLGSFDGVAGVNELLFVEVKDGATDAGLIIGIVGVCWGVAEFGCGAFWRWGGGAFTGVIFLVFIIDVDYDERGGVAKRWALSCFVEDKVLVGLMGSVLLLQVLVMLGEKVDCT